MDGRALLNSLADWTAESHPNVSVEARQRNNDLMGELRTELFTLLGNTSQVGGGDCAYGISLVQPMDEALVRELSPAELTYRLDLAETAMTGGGGTGNSIGFLHKLKIMTGLRKFNQFVDDFEKLRAQINKNMAGYEVEIARGKSLTDAIVTDIRQIFLNEKVRVMWTIIKAQEGSDMKEVKTNIFDQRIKRVEMEIQRLKVKLAVNVEAAKKVFMVKGILNRKYGSTRGALWWKKGNFMDKTIAEVTAQEQAYLKLDKEMNYFMKEIEHAKNLKLLEAAAGGKTASELTKQQRKEIAEYQKNREKYEKMFAFGETRREEYEKILSKKEKIVLELNFFKTTLTAGTYITKQEQMQILLNNWDLDIGRVYYFLSTAIKNSNDYKKDLDKLRGLVLDNGNNISKLTAGKSEFEDLKKFYDKYLEQCEKAYDIQEGIANALGEIKEKFKELIPDASLLPDMFRVVQAQAFVLSIVNDILALKQNELGGTADKGKKYLEDKIKKMKGGANESNLELQQTGGTLMFLNPGYFPPHGGAFFDHDDGGRVWNESSGAGDKYEAAATAPGTSVKILTLPYGVRRISGSYITKVNNAIAQIDSDKRIYIPLLNYNELDRERVFILTAIYQPESGIFRVTGAHIFRLSQWRSYEHISDNYYFYNIVEYNNDPTIDNAFSHEFKTICDRLPQIKLDNKQYIILPMFYRLGHITNPLFDYHEYVLLHPLLGSVMTATLNELELNAQRDTRGTADQVGYDFNTRNLNLRLKMHSEQITDVAKLRTLTNNDDYYYNFSGPIIIKKAHPTGVGATFFTTTNHSFIDNPSIPPAAATPTTRGNLQHDAPAPPAPPDANLFTPNNAAQYAHYMFQLTGHLNELIKKITLTKLNYVSGTLTPVFTGSPYTDPITYNIPYNMGGPAAPREIINTTPQFQTKLDKIGRSKSWDNDYLSDFFETSNTNELVWIFHSIKMMLADVIYYTRRKSWPLNDAKSGMSLNLFNNIYSSAVTAAGVSPGSPGTGGPGTKTGTPGALSPINPQKFKSIIAYLRNALPDNSSYFSNLPEMTSIIKKFSSPEYQTYSNLLFQTYDIMQVIRKYEDKILDIKAEKDKNPLPEYSLIAKNLEPNVQPGSKDAYTGAGQKLYDKIKENKNYIKLNEYTVSTDNLVRDCEDLIHNIKAIDIKKFGVDVDNIYFFQSSPGDKYVDILRNRDNAIKFVDQLMSSKYFARDTSKVCYALIRLLNLKAGDPTYEVYDAKGKASEFRDQLRTAGQKKGKKNQNKKGNTHRTH